MNETDCRHVLAAYPDGYQPRGAESIAAVGRNDASPTWRVDTVSGPMLLRCWSPTMEESQLQFMQAVLWHVTQEGFHHVPLPLETSSHAGYIRHGNRFWQLEPWAHGAPDDLQRSSEERLVAATIALAEFHRAAETFPIAHRPMNVSNAARLLRAELEQRLARGLAAPPRSDSIPAEPRPLADALVGRLPDVLGNLLTLLSRGARLACRMQPCIGDIHPGHVFFDDDYVTALIGFGSLGVDTVALDIARLLGGMAGSDARLWLIGLDAYQMVRSLTDNERYLVVAFDRASTVVHGLRLLERLSHGGLERPSDTLRLRRAVERMEGWAETPRAAPTPLRRSA